MSESGSFTSDDDREVDTEELPTPEDEVAETEDRYVVPDLAEDEYPHEVELDSLEAAAIEYSDPDDRLKRKP